MGHVNDPLRDYKRGSWPLRPELMSTPQRQRAAAIRKLEKSPTSIAISTPLPRKPPTGKHIIFLDCSQPTCPPFLLGLKPAAAALGWTVSNISFQPTPEAEVAALGAAIQQKPDGIFVTGLARAVIQSALSQAQAAHIPVVDGYTTNAVKAQIIARVGKYFAPPLHEATTYLGKGRAVGVSSEHLDNIVRNAAWMGHVKSLNVPTTSTPG
jgi:hypothetical protein